MVHKYKAKEVAEHIVMMVKANKLAGKETNIDELTKLIFDYGQEIKNYRTGDRVRVYRETENREDSPHHYTNRLD